MDQQLRQSGRETSERLQRKIAYGFVNRINTFKGFEKNPEERGRLKQIKAEHKNLLRAHYGESYTKRILNIPQFVYQIVNDN